MGVLCVDVHVPPEGGRVVFVSGGDDQAVCVAEVELREQPTTSSDQASRCEEERGHTCGSSEKTSARERCRERSVYTLNVLGSFGEIIVGSFYFILCICCTNLGTQKKPCDNTETSIRFRNTKTRGMEID